MIRISHALILTLLASSYMSMPAHAQDAKPAWERFGFKDDSTNKGKLRAVDPGALTTSPFHWRGFKIYARMDTEEEYNDNIYATEDDADADFITRFKPSATVVKDVGRHQFTVKAKGEMERYADSPDENTIDGEAQFGGVLEAYRSFVIPFNVTHGVYHTDRDKVRGTSFGALTRKPVEYSETTAETGFRYQPNRLGLSVMGRTGQTRYKNGETNSGAEAIYKDGDFDQTEIDARLSYATQTSFEPYVQVKWADQNMKNREYVAGSGFTGNDRSNKSFLARLGSTFDYKGLVTGFLSIGRENRTYDQSNIDDASSLSFAGAVQLILNPKWKLNLDAGVSTAEDTLIKAGMKKRGFGIGLDYELQQDLFATLGVNYNEDEFTSLVRTDETWELGGGMRYVISPRLSLSAEYLNRMRDSDAADADLDNHMVILRLSGAL